MPVFTNHEPEATPSLHVIERGDRPWGHYDVLVDTPNHKVKRIFVNPGHRLSYQSHNRRSEVWTIVAGLASVTLDDKIFLARIGDIVVVPVGTKHRIYSHPGYGTLEFTEVQVGDYFGEDDIIRYQDDYARENDPQKQT